METYRETAAPLPEEVAACKFAWEVQDACNMRAIVAAWVVQMDAMRKAGINGDRLLNHPSTIAMVSKLASLCRIQGDCGREMDGISACARIAEGKAVVYEVIPL